MHTRVRPTASGKYSVAVVTQKRRRRDAEVTSDEPIGHLVVPPAADAVDELVRDDQAKEQRQHQRTRRQSHLVLAQPLTEPRRSFPAVSIRIEDEFGAAVELKDPPAVGRKHARPRAVTGGEVVEPERRFNRRLEHLHVRHRTLLRADLVLGAVFLQRRVVVGRNLTRPREDVVHEHEVRLAGEDRRCHQRVVTQAEPQSSSCVALVIAGDSLGSSSDSRRNDPRNSPSIGWNCHDLVAARTASSSFATWDGVGASTNPLHSAAVIAGSSVIGSEYPGHRTLKCFGESESTAK
jgi:hypothetical protein